MKVVLVAEFNGACDGYETTQSTPNGTMTIDYCDRILANTQAYPEDVWWYWLIMVAQFVFFRLFALFLLQKKASKFY
jgi:hypothetical protein